MLILFNLGIIWRVIFDMSEDSNLMVLFLLGVLEQTFLFVIADFPVMFLKVGFTLIVNIHDLALRINYLFLQFIHQLFPIPSRRTKTIFTCCYFSNG